MVIEVGGDHTIENRYIFTDNILEVQMEGDQARILYNIVNIEGTPVNRLLTPDQTKNFKRGLERSRDFSRAGMR